MFTAESAAPFRPMSVTILGLLAFIVDNPVYLKSFALMFAVATALQVLLLVQLEEQQRLLVKELVLVVVRAAVQTVTAGAAREVERRRGGRAGTVLGGGVGRLQG